MARAVGHSSRARATLGVASLALALVSLSGCGAGEGADAGVSVDAAGLADASMIVDASIPDAGPSPDAAADAGFVDAGFEDAAVPDAGALGGPVNVDLSAARPPAQLSAFRFFAWRDGVFEHNARVVPYDLAMPLFSDYALKARALWIPEGTTITYDARDVFDFPVGTAIIKSFLFPADLRQPDRDVKLLETRVLVRYADGWRAYPYLWRDDGSDADYAPGGASFPVTFVDARGETKTAQYLVPQRNQCLQCHELKDDADERYTTIIGPKARHLNRTFEYDGVVENQLGHLAELGLLVGLPDLATVERDFALEDVIATGTAAMSRAELDKAARDYLDVNCAHCHNPRGVQGVTSQLFLDVYETDPFHLGVCKEPGSAGRGTGGFRYDVVPGDPDTSILHYRVATEIVGDMMPLIGRSLRHDAGVALVRAWIEGMPPMACP
ncbi:hypothetical protein L6R52_03580 [Myxococcota bacterium]|nr:hypothetical protein [Myxococcota bacterium]